MTTLRNAVAMAIEAIERGSSTAPVVECLRAALAMDAQARVLCTFGPPGEREQRYVLHFEDRDMGRMYFNTSVEAFDAFRRFATSYTCTLFSIVSMPTGGGVPRLGGMPFGGQSL